MFDRLRGSKLLFWSVELLVIATLIFVSTKINFLFSPIATFFSTLFTPILLAGFLFYLLNPLVKFIMKTGLSRGKSVAIVFVIFVLLTALFIGAILPNLVKQIVQLINNLPAFAKSVEKWTNELMSHPYLKNIDINEYLKKMDISVQSVLKQVLNAFSTSLSTIISSVANVTVIIVTVPFILFYMLKDGPKMIPAIEKYLPQKRKKEIIVLVGKMSDTISAYISGQAIECLFVGVCTWLGYWAIGIDYAFLFGCIAGITNMVPYLGPYLGLAPAIFVTVLSSPVKALLACILVLVIQQIDGNIIYPNVIGKSLDIHPLTIIIILLVAGNISGLLGMILGVPLYAVCKTIFKYVYDIVQLNKTAKEEPDENGFQEKTQNDN
ncbi:AI-2E family transporter [Vagococcus entomophilus]|uniref:AI-2E family transporter n=1 Tax=Vagococcus entomophilus TaxID=1160095 RepID=A0A430AJW1_9ENTE|nr:AI-2E family transporter [Vagococcus entomophilus]RSU08348.1 AI-2E family transporter [Vagococcus entomophilus]